MGFTFTTFWRQLWMAQLSAYDMKGVFFGAGGTTSHDI